MKQIQSMPDIWDDTPFTTSRSVVLGAFAQIAVRQSPYPFLLVLVSGLTEFNSALVCDNCFTTSCRGLYYLVREAIDRCPTVQDWNVPKKGKHIMVFISSHDQPDYDFIDLDAMARNIAHAVTLEAKYNDLHE